MSKLLRCKDLRTLTCKYPKLWLESVRIFLQMASETMRAHWKHSFYTCLNPSCSHSLASLARSPAVQVWCQPGYVDSRYTHYIRSQGRLHGCGAGYLEFSRDVAFEVLQDTGARYKMGLRDQVSLRAAMERIEGDPRTARHLAQGAPATTQQVRVCFICDKRAWRAQD